MYVFNTNNSRRTILSQKCVMGKSDSIFFMMDMKMHFCYMSHKGPLDFYSRFFDFVKKQWNFHNGSKDLSFSDIYPNKKKQAYNK